MSVPVSQAKTRRGMSGRILALGMKAARRSRAGQRPCVLGCIDRGCGRVASTDSVDAVAKCCAAAARDQFAALVATRSAHARSFTRTKASSVPRSNAACINKDRLHPTIRVT